MDVSLSSGSSSGCTPDGSLKIQVVGAVGGSGGGCS